MADPHAEGIDRALLRDIVQEESIITTPGLRLDELLLALLERLMDWLGSGPDVDLSPVVTAVQWVGLSLVLLVVVGVLWRLIRGRAHRRVVPAARARTAPLSDPPDPVSALEAALAAGDARAALAALWAEVALGLGQAGVSRATGRDRTHQELVGLVRGARPDWSGLGELRELARTLDRLCYGAVPPTVADVRALVPRARGLLA